MQKYVIMYPMCSSPYFKILLLIKFKIVEHIYQNHLVANAIVISSTITKMNIETKYYIHHTAIEYFEQADCHWATQFKKNPMGENIELFYSEHTVKHITILFVSTLVKCENGKHFISFLFEMILSEFN